MTVRPSCVIVVDGGIDLPPGMAAELGLHVVPLMVHFGSEVYKSGVDLTPAAFFARLRERGEFPSTSQPSAGEFIEVYRKAAESGLPILSIHVSSGLSGTFNSARTAKEMLPDLDITLVDTKTLSGEMAMQVVLAVDLARKGTPVADIVAALGRTWTDSELFFTVDKLDYLRKGGRIGRVAGAVAGLLGIRPVVTVDKATGTYAPVAKARSFRKAIDEIAERIIADVGEGKEATIMIMHGDVWPEAERLAETLKSRLKVVGMHILHVNPSLGAHTGADALGIAYYPGSLPSLSVQPVGVR